MKLMKYNFTRIVLLDTFRFISVLQSVPTSLQLGLQPLKKDSCALFLPCL